MATYANKQDIDDVYGVQVLIRVADHNKDGAPDPEVVEKGLQQADGIINAYLAAQYTLPLSYIPEALKTCAIDIAVYKMALGFTQRTEEMRVRYEDALKLLDRYATAKVVIPPDPDGGVGGDGTTPPNTINRKGRSYDIGRA